MQRKEIFKLLKIDGNQLEFLEDKHKNDQHIALEAILQNPDSFKFCSQNLKSNIEVVKSAVRKNVKNAQEIHKNFFQNPKNVFTILKFKPNSFHFFPKEFQKDTWCIMCYLRFTSQSLEKYSQETEHLVNLITFDKYRTWRLIKNLVKENAFVCGHAISKIRNLYYTEREILEAFSNNKEFFRTLCSNKCGRFCVTDLLDDSNFFFELLAMDYSVFSCLSFKYRRDELFIRRCLLVNPEVYLQYFSRENYFDKYLKISDMLLMVVEKHPSSIWFALIYDLEIYKQAIGINREVWRHIKFQNFDDSEKNELENFYHGILLKFHSQSEKFEMLTNLNFYFKK
jgi:hypothetical protein